MKNGYSVIDSNSFELIDTSNMLIVEENFGEIIKILNKKGYLTKLYGAGNFESYHMVKHLIPHINKKEVNNQLLSQVLLSSIFIVFNNNYEFNSIPDGFIVVDNPTGLFYQVKYYKNENIFDLRDFEELFEEKNKYLEILKNWAKELPERKDDKNE